MKDCRLLRGVIPGLAVSVEAETNTDSKVNISGARVTEVWVNQYSRDSLSGSRNDDNVLRIGRVFSDNEHVDFSVVA